MKLRIASLTILCLALAAVPALADCASPQSKTHQEQCIQRVR